MQPCEISLRLSRHPVAWRVKLEAGPRGKPRLRRSFASPATFPIVVLDLRFLSSVSSLTRFASLPSAPVAQLDRVYDFGS
jgi:hypothetical protein